MQTDTNEKHGAKPAITDTADEPIWVRGVTVAKRYAISRACVSQWAKQGLVPSIKFGTMRRYDLRAVIRIVEGRGAAK